MSVKWNKTKTPGVRYYYHKTRKNGVRRDRYFTIRYRLEGKAKEEALGWESQGWTERKAAARLNELKENQRTGVGAKTLEEKRKIALEKEKLKREDEAKKEKELISFSSVFKRYSELSYQDKAARTCKNETVLYKNWIEPVFITISIKDISPFLIEKLKKYMSDNHKSPKTISHALALVGQVFNYAKAHDLYDGENPTAKVKKPTEDNRRSRFLSQEEAEALLEELAKASSSLRDMALLSLHCGLRAGEIFNLTWSDVDLRNGSILIKDTKSGRNRNAVMTSD
ncbi:MAG: tyrosine-type recombinase/integrase, partial [Holosporaceae bacterium]|nr:tyrosine-type recombinase/integrase [Holosporaceae bacterium]